MKFFVGTTDLSSSTLPSATGNEQNPIHQRIHALKKQLEIELKVKAGAETLLTTYSGQRKESSRKMCDEAQILLKDAKAKVEYIRLEIKRLENELLSPKMEIIPKKINILMINQCGHRNKQFNN